ncbi:hypothetical protein BGX27_002436 [Mortierella sp. AM989]|nr:hypothetical protein BGX27_002436 [Mortierella sp. AM989]
MTNPNDFESSPHCGSSSTHSDRTRPQQTPGITTFVTTLPVTDDEYSEHSYSEGGEDEESENEEEEDQDDQDNCSQDESGSERFDSDSSDDMMVLLTNRIRADVFGSLSPWGRKKQYQFPVAFKTIHPSSPRFSEKKRSRPTLSEEHLPLKMAPRAADWNPDPASMEVFLPQNNDDNNGDEDSPEMESEDEAEEAKKDKELESATKKAIAKANEKFDKEYGPVINGSDVEDDDDRNEDDDEEKDKDNHDGRNEDDITKPRRAWFLDGWDEVWEIPDCRQFEIEDPIVYEMMKPSDITVTVMARTLSQYKLTSLYDGVKKINASWSGPKPYSRRRYSTRERWQTRFNLWDTTHIVTDMDTFEEVSSYFGFRHILGRVMVVRYEWLERTIQEKKAIDPRPYGLRRIKISDLQDDEKNDTVESKDQDESEVVSDHQTENKNMEPTKMEDSIDEKGEAEHVNSETMDKDGLVGVLEDGETAKAKCRDMDVGPSKRTLEQIDEELEQTERSFKKAKEE